MDDKALARAKAKAEALNRALDEAPLDPIDQPQSLFKIRRIEEIGEVFTTPFGHGKPPLIAGFEILGEHINNMTQNGDRSYARFEFEFGGQGFTIERETFEER